MAFRVDPPWIDGAPGRITVLRGPRALSRLVDETQELADGCKGQDSGRGRGRRREKLRLVLADEAGVQARFREGRVRNDALQERYVGRHPGDAIPGQRFAHASQRACAVLSPDHELGDHRVVELRDLVAGAHAGVDANEFRRGRRLEVSDPPDRGQKAARRILGVDARLDGVPKDVDGILRERQGLAGGDAQLPFDQIEAGDHFGDGMLDLQPGVHFHEVKQPALVDDEFDRSRADVADRLCRRDRGCAHFVATLARHSGRGCLLENFLVPALHRAVALEQVHAMAVRVGEDLHFDVSRRLEVFFEEYLVVAERRPCASRRAEASAAAKSACLSTMRMPLPPPPADALISTG